MDMKQNQELYSLIMKQLVECMDEAESRDCFYIAVALSRNMINPEAIPSDIFYMLYLNSVRYIEQYNLSDLSYFLLLFSNPYVRKLLFLSFRGANPKRVLVEDY
jgi:hypothetical protein